MTITTWAKLPMVICGPWNVDEPPFACKWSQEPRVFFFENHDPNRNGGYGYMAVGQNQWCHFGVGLPPILEMF